MQYGTTGVTLKDSVYALKDPGTAQYIALADENRSPRLAPLHLATTAPVTETGRTYLEQLASRRGVACELERVDRL